MKSEEKSLMMERISGNLKSVRQKIQDAALRSGRNESDITLVAVTKTVGSDAMLCAIQLGVEVVGENRVQEAKDKYNVVGDKAQWHFIGHLQKNKVKYMFKFFSMIHSVDSYELAEEISNKAAARSVGNVDILLQVNVGDESTKHGFRLLEALEESKKIAVLPNICLRGFMAIPPPAVESPEESRPYFKKIIELGEKVKNLNLPGANIDSYSFGMSGDYEVAVEEGATHVRVGSAIFGERDA